MSVEHEHDSVSGASYVRIVDAPVDTTVHLTDLVMVDIDADGEPMGVEFAMGIQAVSIEDQRALTRAFPQLEKLLADLMPSTTEPPGNATAIRLSSVSRVRIDSLRSNAEVTYADVDRVKVAQ